MESETDRDPSSRKNSFAHRPGSETMRKKSGRSVRNEYFSACRRRLAGDSGSLPTTQSAESQLQEDAST